MTVAQAYDECEAITRREARNFAYGIRLLRGPERRALSAVYALARRIDDIGDGSASGDDKLLALERVRADVTAIETSSDPVLVAVRDSAARYGLPMLAFCELIDGCEMDVTGTRYETIDDLVVYCRRVAGTIGRLSLCVFGSGAHEGAVSMADDLGVALQLTNILRDLVEDRANGRIYLPVADARAVGCPEDLSGPHGPLADLVSFECSRARSWFAKGMQLLPLLDHRSRACVGAMAGIYRRLLQRIEADPASVLAGRISVPAPKKVILAARAIAGRIS
ncbi:MAG: phytoene/squalene synthase family protein [Acidimicrobiales bacterium]